MEPHLVGMYQKRVGIAYITLTFELLPSANQIEVFVACHVIRDTS